jgi:tetratricopeptide (TPR) repeat protein
LKLSRAALLLAVALAPSFLVREDAYRANNRGVALLEQFRAEEAAQAFREALRIDPGLAIARLNLAIALFNVPDPPAARREAAAAAEVRPDLPQPQYILGLVARAENRVDDAQAAFRKVLALDPADVGARVNLGQILLQERRYDEAIAELRAAIASEPYNATAVYNLGLALTRAGQAQDGQAAMERFRALRDSGAGTLIGQTYPEQGRYAEAIASTGSEPELVDKTTPAVRFVDTEVAPPDRGPAAGRVALFDVDGDGDLDLYVVDANGQRLYRNDGGRFADQTQALSFDPAQGGVGAAAGDVDNDGRPDLLVLRAHGATLHKNGERGFADVTHTAGIPAEEATRATAALVDADHDGDLDVFLGGAAGAPSRLLQNRGDGTFKDVAATAGLADAAEAVAAVPTDFDNRRDVDLLVLPRQGPPRLFRNLRDGSFKDVAGEVGLGPGPFRVAAAADVNKDGFTDFFLAGPSGEVLALSDGKAGFRLQPAPTGAGTEAAVFVDYDNDGLLDLLATGARGARLFRNLGTQWTEVTEAALPAPGAGAGASLAAADLDGDGDVDLLLRLPTGALRLWRNEGGEKSHSMRVRLSGLVSNRSGVGAKVEVRAGSLREKLETYAATPAPAPADLVFGLGPRPAADAVRVLWPSGILQTELPESKLVMAVKELDRKPSSCPYLYAWDGHRFEFVTDFMGGGEMGYWEGPGEYNHPDPDEYVRLTDEQLVPRDGRYELRVTNELEEALFVDRLALLAVDHPADVEIFPDEGMRAAPPSFRLFAARRPRPPLVATDDHGHDVLPLVARRDHRWPDDFRLQRIRGYADEHALTLDLGPSADLLLLTGWTDYAFSSDNVAAHQADLAMQPPRLEVEGPSGRWETAVNDVGIPVGRPQTIVVDLAGKWRGPSRRVRIVTNMRIYWDQVRVAESGAAPAAAARLEPMNATLRERGFSAETEAGYDYQRVSWDAPWKVMPGRYTRTGGVRELLLAADDMFVVSKPGDEIAVSFDARALPPLPSGRRRTFLLYADGFSKEMDLHSASPDQMAPLPFHGMSRYPYSPPEAYPTTAERRAYLERYNTRIIRLAMPPLELAAR